jgi:8-oxo-dGTP pyrophosphatase MutT (NUDIX family)
MRPRLLDTQLTPLSPYVTVVARKVDIDGRVELFHGMKVGDYVNVLPIGVDGRITLVEQFRPMLDRDTIEFPGGHRDMGEEPIATAARELREETGLIAGRVSPICELAPDPGRLTNKFWGFVATECVMDAAWTPEPEARAFSVDAAELSRLIETGRLDNAPHVALYALALARSFLFGGNSLLKTD